MGAAVRVLRCARIAHGESVKAGLSPQIPGKSTLQTRTRAFAIESTRLAETGCLHNLLDREVRVARIADTGIVRAAYTDAPLRSHVFRDLPQKRSRVRRLLDRLEGSAAVDREGDRCARSEERRVGDE